MAELTETQQKKRERLVKKLKGKPGVENIYALATWMAKRRKKRANT